MKKLQNNFTTKEQSKRLLELGVPADSADCYNVITHIGKIPDGITYKNVWQMSTWRNKNGSHIEMYPCWSVDRLMEIWDICNLYTDYSSVCGDYSIIENYIEHMVVLYEYGIKDREFNFSKLEEEV